MTKIKAFFICFITPIVFEILMVYLFSSRGIHESPVILVAYGSVVPFLLSFFVTPALVGGKWGTEFRKFGFYGSLVSLLVIILSANSLSALMS